MVWRYGIRHVLDYLSQPHVSPEKLSPSASLPLGRSTIPLESDPFSLRFTTSEINMENKLPTTKGLEMVTVYGVMVGLSTITFALRVYVRSRLVRRAWEDWAAGVGWFLYFFFCATSMVGPFYGTGQHADLIPLKNLTIALRVRMPTVRDLD